jgi:hypothetical protein
MPTDMESPAADLPAAHSMDTEWFAIDGHGHVGVFNTHETGELPVAHYPAWDTQTNWIDLLDEMVRLAPQGTIRFVAEGVFDERRDPYEEGVPVTQPYARQDAWEWESPVLLELDAPRDPALLDRMFESAHVLACEQPLVYVSRCPTLDVYDAWGELGIVCALLDVRMHPSRFGVFYYSYSDYSYEPYQRIATPMSAPLRVESLATGLRRRLADVRLPGVDFRHDAEENEMG